VTPFHFFTLAKTAKIGDSREAGLPDFSRDNIPKREKYTKKQENVPNGIKIYTIWP
jgi:hypothetical protein